jgi:putative transposase
MINKSTKLSMRRQCALLTLNRSGLDYAPAGPSQEDIDLMHEIDKIHIRRPFYGSRNIVTALAQLGYLVNRKRVQRLMRLMEIHSIAPAPDTSKPRKEDVKYPYLLRGLTIDRPNQVWATDITYIPLRHGFAYLVAVIDWYSRFVLSWRLSNSMDTSFCIEALNEAIERYGRPDIFNSDQGSQFTDKTFAQRLIDEHIAISRDGKGRWIDNVFVERLWRSLKHEDVYPNGYQEVRVARVGIGGYMDFFNDERPHQSLGNCTPREIYTGKKLLAAA